MDGHKTNESHLALKNPLPNHEKGEQSNPKDDKVKAKVNYTYIYDDVVMSSLSNTKHLQNRSMPLLEAKQRLHFWVQRMNQHPL